MDDQNILDQSLEKKFKTKTGFCLVTIDQLILTRDGVRGNLARITTGNHISHWAIVNSLLALWILYSAYGYYSMGDTFLFTLYGLAGLYLIFAVFKSLNYSMSPVIERRDVRSVTFVKGFVGLSRPRFVVDFEERGKMKKRMILLPGLPMGKGEVDKTVRIMKEEGLLPGA